MKKIVACLLALLVFSTQCLAADRVDKPNPFQDWLTYYYIEKNSTQMPDFLKWIETSRLLDEHPDAVPSLEGFLATVFAQNPDKVDAWTHATVFSGKAKEAVQYAIKPTVPLQTMEITTSTDVDRMWGAFSASGNNMYLNKIVDVLDPKKRLSSNVKQDDATRLAAAYSLGANMTQHEAVDRFLTAQSAQRGGEIGIALQHIVSNVRQQRDEHALPNRNGDFSAMLFVTDPKVASKELARASGDIVHFREMAHAKKGDKRTVVIVFAGMQLTPDYMADVSYDVQQIDPKGKTFSDIKDLVAIKRRIPTRFRMFSNAQAIFISFDKKDKPGIYQVRVLLKDNVGKKTIPMSAKIILKR